MRRLTIVLALVATLVSVPMPASEPETVGQFTPCNPRVQQCG